MPIRARLPGRESVRASEAVIEKPEPHVEEEPKKPKVSVVVVSHNRAPLLRQCLGSLERSESRETMEIIAVDNGSDDGSPQLEPEFPKARFIRIPRNFGLTKALNLGTRASEGEYIFFLHEDTEVFPDTIRELAAALDAQTDATAACPLLVGADGEPAPQLSQLPPDGNWRPALITPEPVPVEYARGAALMVRSFFLKALRQIDERYGQFGSDAELCYQIRRSGKKILLLPHVRTRHRGRESSSPLREADYQLGRAVYLGRHYGLLTGLQARIGAILGALGSLRLGELKYLLSSQKIDGSQS